MSEPMGERAPATPSGDAVALGSRLSGTGAVLVGAAPSELERTDGSLGLVTLCCGGGLGTGAILERPA